LLEGTYGRVQPVRTMNTPLRVQSQLLTGTHREPHKSRVFGGGGSGAAILVQKGPLPEAAFP
jgi:hypothetical protein